MLSLDKAFIAQTVLKNIMTHFKAPRRVLRGLCVEWVVI